MNTLTAPAGLAPASTRSPASEPAAASTACAPFRIAPGAMLVLRRGRGMRIEVIEGRLWVTARGDAQDHFIGPGGQHTLGQVQAVVIENLGPAPALLRIVPDR